MMSTMPHRRLMTLLLASSAFIICVFFLRPNFTQRDVAWLDKVIEPSKTEAPGPSKVKYKPTPTYTPPPVRDPFPLLSTSTPPPIPRWNQPRPNLHKDYDLPTPPPLLIGFTRTWPILLQAVVSYITAGWPPEQIYVVENTGVQMANARGQLSLQNPFFLNHTQLAALGVHVIQTPVLLTFAQLQNFFLHLATAHDWPYYFWSHQDVLTLSYEAGLDGVTPPYNQPGYKTVYELGCDALRDARRADPRWGVRFFAYDHLALVNPAAYADAGGWDVMIPFYMTDCDMHSRVLMRNWSMLDRPAATVTDTGAALADLRALYRDPAVRPDDVVDPNPPPPSGAVEKRGGEGGEEEKDPNLRYYWALRHASDLMFWAKHGERGRNTWQAAQHGGAGEPFAYPADGFAEAIDVVTEAGKEVYRRKWGHRDCDLIAGAGLTVGDQWRVEKDWE